MELSAGFLVLAFSGGLVVVLPSLGTGWALWRRGGLSRVVALVSGTLVLAMASLGFAVTDSRQLEEAVLSSLLLWGVSFYVLAGLGAIVLLTKYAIGLTRRSSGPPSAAAELKS